jgi:murein DD-endopeptidase MepM/ murein hydrolase activator NlpD
MAMSGCCDELTSHRGAVMAVNGVQRIGQRFAIDWLQLRPDGRLFVGDRAKLGSYAYLGAPVFAVADGVVVNMYDSAKEQTPGASTGITSKDIGGNMLVIDIGGGHFTFFGHLKPGSLKVKLGDHVTRGQLIAQLGNTGQTEAPHLHFQVMDGPSPINANGLPYVMSRFTVQGLLDEARLEAVFAEGAQAIIKSSPADGPHTNQLPLNEEVIDFPD